MILNSYTITQIDTTNKDVHVTYSFDTGDVDQVLSYKNNAFNVTDESILTTQLEAYAQAYIDGMDLEDLPQDVISVDNKPITPSVVVSSPADPLSVDPAEEV